MSQKTRSRAWCFTINNFTEEDEKEIQGIDGDYVYQPEVGEKGTPHLQGVLRLKHAKTFSAMKKVNGRAHWERCKNWIASVQYCMKQETSAGDIRTNMDLIRGNCTAAQTKNKKMSGWEVAARKACTDLGVEFHQGVNLGQMLWDLDMLEQARREEVWWDKESGDLP